jgi:peptidoglycan/LPS O-acetylase OafA/YrhL
VSSAERAPRRLGHRPALDGIRGLAWSVVFCAHAWIFKLAVGQVAMFVFFALSGFLITALLIQERFSTGRVSLPNFFARRALRLLPALAFFLVGWLAIVLATGGHAPWTTTVPGGGSGTGTSPLVALEGVGAALLYLTNWAGTWGWFSGYVPLGHLWSLAVEEQFYLLWSPVVVLLLRCRSRAVLGWAAGLAATASFLDVALRDGHRLSRVVDMSTDTRAGSFLVGALLALAWTQRAWWLPALREAGRRCIVVFCLLVFLWGSWVFDHRASRPIFTLAWIAVSVAAGLLVVALLSDEPRTGSGMVSSPVVTYVGRRSYALYLWHYVWLTWLAGFGPARVPLALAATFACAELSWQIVERPALARKGRFTSGAARVRSRQEPVSSHSVERMTMPDVALHPDRGGSEGSREPKVLEGLQV